MSRRTERFASLVRSILAEAIQSRLSDPRIERLTSITRVEVSPDLSLARVFVSVMAPDNRRQLTLQALEHAVQHLRRCLGERLVSRQVPELVFRLDDSLQQSFRTVQELDRLMAELGERPEDDRPESNEDDEEGDARAAESENSERLAEAGSERASERIEEDV